MPEQLCILCSYLAVPSWPKQEGLQRSRSAKVPASLCATDMPCCLLPCTALSRLVCRCMPAYCHPTHGPLNLATMLPWYTKLPDLGPKGYVAFGR